MPRSYTLTNQSKIVLCIKHARAISDQIVTGDANGKAACAVCVMGRRLTFGGTDDFSVTTDKGYIVTRHIDGSISCTCLAWKFQKRVPPMERRCKHCTVFERINDDGND